MTAHRYDCSAGGPTAYSFLLLSVRKFGGAGWPRPSARTATSAMWPGRPP
jgi:hypothetical protein